MTGPRLKSELARHFAPEAAPDELWERVQTGLHEPRRTSLRVPAWAIAAVLLLGTAALWLLQPGLAEIHRALASHPDRLELTSADPGEIAAWLKINCNLELRLPKGPAHLLGARLVRHRGSKLVAISYRIGAEAATLFIGRDAGSSAPSHAARRLASAGEVHLISWRSADRFYTLATTAADPNRACILCHLN